jgi:hypothetical protein
LLPISKPKAVEKSFSYESMSDGSPPFPSSWEAPEWELHQPPSSNAHIEYASFSPDSFTIALFIRNCLDIYLFDDDEQNYILHGKHPLDQSISAIKCISSHNSTFVILQLQKGIFMLFDSSAELIFTYQIHIAEVLSIKVTHLNDIVLLHDDKTITILDGTSLAVAIKTHQPQVISFSRFLLKSHERVADVISLGSNRTYQRSLIEIYLVPGKIRKFIRRVSSEQFIFEIPGSWDSIMFIIHFI